jgi:hypothetical protein
MQTTASLHVNTVEALCTHFAAPKAIKFSFSLMKAGQVSNAYDYSSLVLLYIKMGTEENTNAVLSEEDTVAKVYIDTLSDASNKQFHELLTW